MAITAATADQLDALGLSIFNAGTAQPPLVGDNNPQNYPNATGLSGQSNDVDAQYLALIAPVMLAIDGRTMATGLKYTLNMTNATQGRPKHWFVRDMQEYPAPLWPANVSLTYIPSGQEIITGVNSYGFSDGLAFCAAICHAWATIIRMWLAGNYPYAVNPPAA